jgi:hypothetical protein
VCPLKYQAHGRLPAHDPFIPGARKDGHIVNCDEVQEPSPATSRSGSSTVTMFTHPAAGDDGVGSSIIGPAREMPQRITMNFLAIPKDSATSAVVRCVARNEL